MPGHRDSSTSPLRHSAQPLDKSVSEHTGRRGRSQQGQGHSEVNQVGQGLASQLQGIIRDELRRIMEVQHRSVLAMMGAIDQVGGQVGGAYPVTDPAPQYVAPPLVQAKPNSLSQRGRSPCPHKPHGGQALGGDVTENLEDDSVAEMVSFKEEIVAQTSVKTQQKRPQFTHHGNGSVRRVLTELSNLKAQTEQPHPQQSSYAEEISSRASRLFSQQQSQGSREAQGPGNIHFPLLAWSDQPQPTNNSGGGPFPLLHLESTNTLADNDPFRNLRRFLPQVPRPQPSPSQYSAPQGYPQGYLPMSSPSHPPGQYHHQPPAYQDISSLPLLTAGPPPLAPPPTAPPTTGPLPLLRILPPGADDQVSRIEETRQRLLQKFQQQVLEDKRSYDQQVRGQRLLHLESEQSSQQGQGQKLMQQQPQMVAEKLDDTTRSAETLPLDKEDNSKQERAASAQSGDLDATLTEGGHTGSMAEVPINDGYALPRGIFESYMQLGEHLMGRDVDQTSAAFQLKMAQAMQRQVEKRITKVDFSTMTQEQVEASMLTDPAMEVVRTAEAATSITKDTGVDPIEEAVRDYNLRRQNNVVPPDIFMGLRFADQDRQAGVDSRAPSDEPGQGRSFLNVVDIRASAVLRDIPERTEERKTEEEEKAETHPDMGAALLTSQRTALRMGALEESLREKLGSQRGVTPAPKGHDSLTVKMFDQLRSEKGNRMSVAVMPRSSVSEPKSAMLRRLQDMSDQIRAIDDMSQNIEREFKSSHLLLNTLQDVNASIERTRSPGPTRPKGSKSSPARHKELRYSLEESMQEYDDRFDEEEELSTSKALLTPKSSTKSPVVSARSAKSKASMASHSASELTELLSEVLAEQGVDMESAGFTRELAQQIERDAREQISKQDKWTPRSRLENITNQQDVQSDGRSREDRDHLKKWMAEKFNERQEEYKRRRQGLIEREPKPFKSSAVSTKQNLHKLSEERSERRQHMAEDFMNQRLNEAEHLMGSIIVDKPEMPLWGTLATADVTMSESKHGSASTFTGRSGPRKSRSPTRTVTSSHRPHFSSRSPSESIKLPKTAPKGILKQSATSTSLVNGDAWGRHDDLHNDLHTDLHLGNLASFSAEGLSVDSSADLVNYARRILEMEGGDSYEISPPPGKPMRRQPMPATAPRGGATNQVRQKPTKSFADMVRMQRPATTRKWQEVTRQRQQRAAEAQEKLAQEATTRQGRQAGQKTWTIHDPNLVNGKPKEYGSKKIPGSSPRQQELSSARRVKTYAERLQEMKPASRLTSPVASRGRPASARSPRHMTQRGPRGPPHLGPSQRPQAYAGQIRSGGTRGGPSQGKGKTPLKMRTFLRSHGPAHQPKTYTEQLRELNPHPHSDTTRPMSATATASSVGGVSRGPPPRHRPYGDPYSEMDYEELASVLSDWDMDENMRNIIYGGSTNSVAFRDDVDLSMSAGDIGRGAAPSEGQSDYFDVIMQGDGPYRPAENDDLGMGGDYRSSVDIREIEQIADAASVGSGSVLSVIDWDAVNDLIKDV